MNNMLLKIFLLFLSTSITFASEKISYSGRLTSANGAPISGPVSITLDIVTSTPTTLCSITDTSVPLSNGVFHLEVDYGTTCDSSRSLKQIISDAVNASEELFIRVTDNTHTKVYPAQAITSTPLATFALEAASVREGSIVNTDLKGVAANCANNEVIAGDGSGNFKCISASTGSVTSITAGTGLTGGTITSSGTIAVDVGAGAGNIPQLDGSGKLVTSVETDPNVLAFAKSSLPTCNAGEVLKSDGTNFSCVTDDVGTDSDTTYTAGTGIDLTAGQFSIDASACPAGQRMIFGAPGFGCEDADAISLQGNDVDNAAPNDNDVLTWNNATSKWEPRATAATVTNLDDLSDAATTTDNLFLGHSNTMGTSNTGVGITSLDALTTGNFNTSIGDGSLTANQSGSNNVAIGYNAGASNISGSGNVFIGNAAGENETGSNKLYIDNSNTATPLIQGDFSTDIVTINGKLKIVDGTEGATKVLTSSADGTASWTSLSGAGSVTSVDVTAPLVKGGTASDVDLSIPAATTTADGYLSSTDWNIFNMKQDALPSGGTTGQYLRGDLTLSTFVDDVLASVLTGYSAGANTPLAATDNVVGAFSKVQGQINANQTSISTNASDIATNTTDIASKVDKTTTVNGVALSSNIVLDTDDVAEGSTNLYFQDSRAKAAAVINATTGSETDRAPSVQAIKNYITANTGTGDFMADGSVPMTSQLKLADGTSFAPALSFNNDPNTGLFSSGADAIGFATGSIEKMTLASNGNLGIGTPSPSSGLNLHEKNRIQITNSTTGNANFLDGISIALLSSKDMEIRASESGAKIDMIADDFIKFNTSGSNERMRIIQNGNVGIGVTDPDAKLEVAGQVKITGGTPGVGKVLTSDADGLASWTTPTSGTVSSVSATAPLSVTNPTTTPSLSISQANTSTNGYLSSTDWNTFNNKQSALPTGGTTSQYLRGDYTLSTFVDDVLASVLTGYTVGADTPLAATDSVLGAFSKVQGQINDNNTDISTNATNIGTNTTNISNNASAISTNTGNISSNATDIATNASNIASNDTDIAQNASDIAAINESQWTTTGSDIYYNTGNIGMGTPTPRTKLHLFGSAGAAASDFLTIEGAGNAGVGRGVGVLMKVPAGSGTTVDGARIVATQRSGTSTDIAFELGTTGTLSERMRFTHTGKVGVGVSNPISSLDLNNEGKIKYNNFKLNGQSQTEDSQGASYIILHQAYDGALMSDHRVEGRITARRGNTTSSNKSINCLISSSTAYNTDQATLSCLRENVRLVYVDVASVKYIALKLLNTSTRYDFRFDGYASVPNGEEFLKLLYDQQVSNETAFTSKASNIIDGKLLVSENIIGEKNIAISTGSSIKLKGESDSTHRIYHQTATDSDVIEISANFKIDDYNSGTPQTRFRILAGSGNVGIGLGETAPTERLEVSGNVKATAFYGDGSGLTGITADSSSNNVNAIINADADSNSSGEILLQTAGTTRASISNTGDMTLGSAVNSGTGVTSFSVGSATEPSVISLGEDASNNSAITWNNTSNYVSIGTTNASTAYNETLVVRNGKVGIGTNNPVDKLTVKGDTSSLRLESTTANINNSSSIVFAENATDDHFILRYDGSDSVEGSGALTFSGMSSGDILSLNRGGKVGIGTTAPSVKFQVQTESLGTGWKAVNDNFAFLSQDAWQTLVSTSADTWGSSIMLKQVDHATKAYENSWAISRQTNSNGTGDGSLRFTYGTDVSPTENPAMVTFETNGRVGIGTVDPSEQLEVNGNVKAASYLYTSDKRFKKNITLVEAPLAKVDALRGVLFDWRNDEYNDLNLPEGRDYGFIAQEVEEVAPELVHTDDFGYKSVKYANITSILVEAVKSLKDKFNKYFEDNDKEVKELGRKVASLEEENKELKKKSLENERRIEEMEKNLKEILKTMNSNNKNN